MIVTVILLIVGFAIILGIFISIDLKGQSKKDACHQSVVFRGTLPGLFDSKELVPLNCKTEKICVGGSKFIGKNKCEEFEGDKGVMNVEVDNEEDIERLIADTSIDCFNMMGEGQISLFSQYFAESYGFGSIYPTCSICSRLAFNKESIVEKGIDLEKVNVKEYMITHKIPNREESYFEYLSGKEGNVAINDFFGVEEEDISEEGRENFEELVSQEPFGNEEIAVLFMQISAPQGLDSLKNTGAIFGLGAATAPIHSGRALLSLGRFCVSGGHQAIGCAAIGALLVTWQQASVEAKQGVAEGYCGDIALGDDARNGCSVVRTVDYDVKDLRKHCAVIESKS